MSRWKGEFFFRIYMQLLFQFFDSVGIYAHQNMWIQYFAFPVFTYFMAISFT